MHLSPQQDGSFILLLIQQVFNYSINYQHSIYKPYKPRNLEEEELLHQVIQLHFPKLLESGNKLFSVFSPNHEYEIQQNKTVSNDNESSENQVVCLIPDHRDPGLREDFLQELWVTPKNSNQEHPEELIGSYPSWARGVIGDMRRTASLFNRFKESENRTFVSREDIKYQPHHQIINLLIATEFYWILNKREVNLSQKMTNAELNVAIQDYLYTIADQFLKLLPDNHPYRLIVSAEERRSWSFERIRGMMGTKQVLSQFIDSDINQIIECTEYTINLRSERLEEFTPSGMRSKKLIVKEEYDNDEIESFNYKDPGLDEEFLWDLYGASLRDQVKWLFEPADDWPSWAKGILSGMTSTIQFTKSFLDLKIEVKFFKTAGFSRITQIFVF